MSTEDIKPTTRMLRAAGAGDPGEAEELLPLVYEELRSLARSKLQKEAPGQTLQPTALVHEAYLRLVGNEDPGWDGKGHFFGAAASAMRQIPVERARRKGADKRGGGRRRMPLDPIDPISEPPSDSCQTTTAPTCTARCSSSTQDHVWVIMTRAVSWIRMTLTSSTSATQDPMAGRLALSVNPVCRIRESTSLTCCVHSTLSVEMGIRL